MPHFLISRLSALGDAVCTLPVAVALKQAFPGSHITWAVDPRFAGIVECSTAVDEVVRIKPSLRRLPSFDRTFDVALDMQGLLKSAICVGRAKAKRKVGYHWQREGAAFFSERILPDPSSAHVVDQYVDVARAVGATMERAEFGLEPLQEDLTKVDALLAEAGVTYAPAILNAGAGWVSKRWPPEHFADLGRRLVDAGVPVVMIGGPAEADRAAAREVIESSGRPIVDLVGKTSVRELVALLSRARLHVGGDTGSSHLSAALGVPAFGLYSITRPQRSCPYGQIERCFYHPDGLANIRPDSVWAAVCDTLNP